MKKREYQKIMMQSENKYHCEIEKDRPWNYKILINFLEIKLLQMYEYYKKEDEEKYSDIIEEIILVLSYIFDIKIYEGNVMIENELYKRIFNLVGKYIHNWWR